MRVPVAGEEGLEFITFGAPLEGGVRAAVLGLGSAHAHDRS